MENAWKVGDAIIMKTVPLLEQLGARRDPCRLTQEDPSRLESQNVQICHHTEAGPPGTGPGAPPLSIRMFKGTVSELKTVLYPLLPLASPTACIWGHAKLVQIESKTVTLSYCFAVPLSMVFEVLPKII